MSTMTTLLETAQAMVVPGKGILAADESAGTIKKKFDSVNIESNEANRRAYRNMLLTTKGLEQFVSG
ncbi:MAG: fructose-bisphosphate aldolase, partial [Candidatus Latescibacteria bacterium]|nr:fructose-bisphosphate aldolase [Candidatus Latescibacterota bacterium]